jgi:hypothetical protein
LIDDNESEDAPVLNLNTQRASPQQITKAKESGLVVLIDHLRSRQSPGTRGKVLQNLKQASIAYLQQRRGKTSGSVAFSTKAIGCRLECEKPIWKHHHILSDLLSQYLQKNGIVYSETCFIQFRL